jgi:hypothetical protein
VELTAVGESYDLESYQPRGKDREFIIQTYQLEHRSVSTKPNYLSLCNPVRVT